jgi:hypothetical protein
MLVRDTRCMPMKLGRVVTVVWPYLSVVTVDLRGRECVEVLNNTEHETQTGEQLIWFHAVRFVFEYIVCFGLTRQMRVLFRLNGAVSL